MSVVVICVCLFYIITNANTDIPQVKAPARMYYDTILKADMGQLNRAH